jgi:hypothetical protein
MTLQEARAAHQKATHDLSEAIAENQKIEDGLRASEARRITGLREAEKVEVEDGTRVFESLGLPKNAAEFAARGRAA